jgi:ribosomal protein L36
LDRAYKERRRARKGNMVVVGAGLKTLCDRRQGCKVVARKGILTVVTSSSPESMSRGDPPSPPPVPPVPPPSPSRRRFR